MSIGIIIKEARERKNVSQQQVADAVGVTRASVSKWEKDLLGEDVTPRDFLNKPLDVGDEVVFMNIKYRDLNLGKIKKITKKKVKIAYERQGYQRETYQFFGQVIKT